MQEHVPHEPESELSTDLVQQVARYACSQAIYGHGAAERTLVESDGTVTYDM